LKGALQFSGDILSFNPAISTDIEINQNLKPPANSTNFDPDSITARPDLHPSCRGEVRRAGSK